MQNQAIQAHVAAVEIPYLVHFTSALNLPTIMSHGLCPVSRHQEIGLRPHTNDQHRLDGHRGGTSLSVAFPNAQMLWKCKNKEENKGMDWAILVLNPSVLWSLDCAFCRHNAADARISHQALCNLKTVQAFTGMFDPIDEHLTRDDQKLKAYDPTDVQAEVLVFGIIPPELIYAVVFESTNVRDLYLPHLGDRKTYIHAKQKGLFASRGYARKYQ